MIAKLFRIVAVALLLAAAALLFSPALARGQGKGLTGTWKAVVLKKKDEKVSLTKDGFSLLISIDDQAKTWQATAKSSASERTSEGTFSVDDQHYVFAEKNGQKHTLRAHVEGNQLILSPKDDPDTRLVALRVQ